MAKKSNVVFPTINWLNGKGEIVSKSADAIFAEILPSDDCKVITIGDRERTNSRHALTFAQDVYKFHRYENPLTNWDNGIHVYNSIEPDAVYAEDAGTALKGDKWFTLAIKKGALTFERELDPVVHEDDVTERLSKRTVPATIDQIKDAIGREKERANADFNRIKKHEWGFYYGYGFRIYIAHIREYAERIFAIVREPNVDTAWQMRSDAIAGKVLRGRLPASVRSVPNGFAPQTDTPDLLSDAPEGEQPEGEAPVVKEAVAASMLVPFITKENKRNGTVDLYKLPVGAWISLYQLSGDRIVRLGWYRNWDADEANENGIARAIRKLVGNEGENASYGVAFDEHLLAQ